MTEFAVHTFPLRGNASFAAISRAHFFQLETAPHEIVSIAVKLAWRVTASI
jgi:hypothetical protein